MNDLAACGMAELAQCGLDDARRSAGAAEAGGVALAPIDGPMDERRVANG